MIGDRGLFYFLGPGDRFNLKTRQALRLQMTPAPFERVAEQAWPQEVERPGG